MPFGETAWRQASSSIATLHGTLATGLHQSLGHPGQRMDCCKYLFSRLQEPSGLPRPKPCLGPRREAYARLCAESDAKSCRPSMNLGTKKSHRCQSLFQFVPKCLAGSGNFFESSDFAREGGSEKEFSTHFYHFGTTRQMSPAIRGHFCAKNPESPWKSVTKLSTAA